MKTAEWLTILGGVLMLSGLFSAFWSSRLEVKVMGETRKGRAVLAPSQGSPEWERGNRIRWWADLMFWVGLSLTAIGVILQTLGAIWPKLIQ